MGSMLIGAVATNGKVVLGVSDTLRTPPELTAFDTATKRSTRLTDLNPQLAEVRFGESQSRITGAASPLTRPTAS